MNRLLWIVSRILVAIAMALMLYLGWLGSTYSDAGARKPNPRTGQIYVFNNHGDYSYITERQRDDIHYTLAGAFACMVLSLAIEYIRQKKLKRRESYPTFQTRQAAHYLDWLRAPVAGDPTDGSAVGRFKRRLDAEWPVIKPLVIFFAFCALIFLILFSGRLSMLW